MQGYETIETGSPSGKQLNIITGAQLLPDGRLVVSDFATRCVKLFDTNNKRVTGRVKVAGSPCDITVVNENQLLTPVVKNSTQCIQFINVRGGSLTLGTSFQTDHVCSDTAYCDNRIFVTDPMDKTIKSLDMTGRNVQTLDVGLMSPGNMAVSQAHRVLYVSDRSRRRVVCMTLDGKNVSVYKYTHAGTPERMAVHPDGSVYVTGWPNHGVHHLTAQCTYIETILDFRPFSYPSTISCHPDGDRLYVADDKNSDQLKVFPLHLLT